MRLLAIVSLLSSLTLVLSRSVKVRNTCDNIPSVPHEGPGCGIPDYVDPQVFGDNNFSRGILKLSPAKDGLRLNFRLFRLSKPDHVLTAWIVWVDPNDPTKPDVFKFGADYVSPCSAFNAGYSAGLGLDPNRFIYTSRTTAKLDVKLNFNPTFAGEGALMRMTFSFQKDVPGIQKTPLKQFRVPRTGLFVPQGNSFLRKYDEKTGFEMLGKDGLPQVARSPTRAISIIVANHLDKTTHGITPGKFMTDHYDLMVFPMDGVMVGKPTVK